MRQEWTGKHGGDKAWHEYFEENKGNFENSQNCGGRIELFNGAEPESRGFSDYHLKQELGINIKSGFRLWHGKNYEGATFAADAPPLTYFPIEWIDTSEW